MPFGRRFYPMQLSHACITFYMWVLNPRPWRYKCHALYQLRYKGPPVSLLTGLILPKAVPLTSARPQRMCGRDLPPVSFARRQNGHKNNE